jgi:hypothetical protein
LVLFVLLLTLYMLCGCSAIGEALHSAGTMFSAQVEGGPTMEPPPEPSYELAEGLRVQAAFVRAILEEVYASGVAAHNQLVAAAERSAGLLAAHTGAPVEAIPVPMLHAEGPGEEAGVAETVAAVEKARDKTAAMLTDHKQDEEEYDREAAGKLRAPSRKRFSISSPYIMLFGTGGLVATIGGLIFTLRKVALYKGSLARVFLGVTKFIGGPPAKVKEDTPQRKLLDILEGEMDQPHKDVIDKFYKDTATP